MCVHYRYETECPKNDAKLCLKIELKNNTCINITK